MCGRYALHLRPSQMRTRLADQHMPTDSAPADDDDRIRQTYNFAPGDHGLIYRADTRNPHADADDHDGEPRRKRAKLSPDDPGRAEDAAGRVTYKLQAAKWGLVPSWTKRAPAHGSTQRTINCRADSLARAGGLWSSMKQRKRCVVVAEGFYEWAQKNSGRERIPHYVRRADGGLMCFAGLWDCVRDEGRAERLYTYAVVTTESNAALGFLHDRMPVILEPGSAAMGAWLDTAVGWGRELQGVLRPFAGGLECFQVDKAVGKVGNNSASFVVPVDSKDNKKNIANFFGTRASASPKDGKAKDGRNTSAVEAPESHAPIKTSSELSVAINDVSSLPDESLKEAADGLTDTTIRKDPSSPPDSSPARASDEKSDASVAAERQPAQLEADKTPPRPPPNPPPPPQATPRRENPTPAKRPRSTTSPKGTPTKRAHNLKITSFFTPSSATPPD